MALTRVRSQELTEQVVAGAILQDDGTAVPLTALTAATLTLINVETNQIINGWDSRSILNANHIVIATDGAWTWQMQALDNVIVNPRRQVEAHRAVFQFTWTLGSPGVDGGTRQDYEFDVANLWGVTSPEDIAITAEHPEGSTWTICTGTSPARVCTTYTRDNGQDIPVAAVTY